MIGLKIFVICFCIFSFGLSVFSFYSQFFGEERSHKYNDFFKGLFYLFVAVSLMAYVPNPFQYKPNKTEDITSICDISHNRETVVALCVPDIRVQESKNEILRNARNKDSWELKVVEKEYISLVGVVHYRYEIKVK